MPLSAERSLASTTTEEAVELYWELLAKYQSTRNSGSPADYLVTWPTSEHVKQTAREIPDQCNHYGVNKVIAVAGASARVLWRPTLSASRQTVTSSRAKLTIYSRSKANTQRNQESGRQWAEWLQLQSAPELFLNNTRRVLLLATHAALPRQLPVAPYPSDSKPSWREGFFSVHGVYIVESASINIKFVFTVLKRDAPDFLRGKINEDDRPDGSPSCMDQTDIKLELKPIGNRDLSDSFSCVYQVKIMQRDTGEWIPWVPEDMYIKSEPAAESQIKREPQSPGRRSRSPSAGPSTRTFIKQEPEYSLTHRKQAIYGQYEARGGLQRF